MGAFGIYRKHSHLRAIGPYYWVIPTSPNAILSHNTHKTQHTHRHKPMPLINVGTSSCFVANFSKTLISGRIRCITHMPPTNRQPTNQLTDQQTDRPTGQSRPVTPSSTPAGAFVCGAQCHPPRRGCASVSAAPGHRRGRLQA